MRHGLVALVAVLLGCGSATTQPEVVAVPKPHGLVFSVRCPGPTIFEVAADTSHHLWLLPDSADLVIEVGPGRHQVEYIRWHPTISVGRADTLTAPATVRLACAGDSPRS